MVGVAVLPVAYHMGQLYFLFGKVKAIEYGIQGLSDFGGGQEKNETIFEGAIREGCEELTGFYGNATQLREKIKNAGGTFKVNHKNQYHSHIFLTEYDENLPKYFANNHHYLYEKLDHKYLRSTKLFEKIEVTWMTPDEMKKRRPEFRPFYRSIVDRLLQDLSKIRKFIVKRHEKNAPKNKTRKIYE